jgi:uncharacterized protein YecE (DUF72 family)
MTRPPPRIGCSGWNYKSWKGRFYPRELPAARWLTYYSGAFNTVEVNNTFYRLPESSAFKAWGAQTPPTFLMAVKASRFLTHMKRLRDPAEPIARLFSRAAALGSRLGPVLYQLPPNFRIDLKRLESFLLALPTRPSSHAKRRLQHVFEFRDASWYVNETYQLLEQHGMAMCIHDKAGSAIDEPFVGPFVYVRFHGTSGHYHGRYSERTLKNWAARMAEHWHDKRAVYAYFNNDPDAVATQNALSLKRFVDRLVLAREAS